MGTDQIVVRTPDPHELRRVAEVARVALMMPRWADDEWEKWRFGWEDGYVTIAAFDGDRCVGQAGTFQFDTLVPGGAWLPTGGLTRVGVLPTHHRRGVLTRMLRQLLTNERDAGRVLTSLRASEAPIYGRFGYGLAAEANGVAVVPERVRPIAGAADGSFRLLAPDELLQVLPALHDSCSHRVGAISLDAWMWKRYLEKTLSGTEAGHVVVHTSPDGTDDGYAFYSIKWLEGEFVEIGGNCELHHLHGTSTAVELALWKYLTEVGLIRRIICISRPVDDPVRLVAADYRGYQVKERWDEQWLRLLDVPAALAARTYHDRAPVTIAVTDPWFPENDGVYRVSGDGATRTSDSADSADSAELIAPIAAVSAAYLGGTSWSELVSIGAAQGSADAARRADDLFRQTPAPWCGSFF
jgi:predicted acetyltransferase